MARRNGMSEREPGAGKTTGKRSAGTKGPTGPPADEKLAEVERRIAEIGRGRRGKLRLRMSQHTAEMALRAIEVPHDSPPRRGPPPKGRRRKRHKRLL